jgi:hypothetical protein
VNLEQIQTTWNDLKRLGTTSNDLKRLRKL